jgi:hypothetical protein
MFSKPNLYYLDHLDKISHRLDSLPLLRARKLWQLFHIMDLMLGVISPWTIDIYFTFYQVYTRNMRHAPGRWMSGSFSLTLQNCFHDDDNETEGNRVLYINLSLAIHRPVNRLLRTQRCSKQSSTCNISEKDIKGL